MGLTGEEEGRVRADVSMLVSDACKRWWQDEGVAIDEEKEG